MAAGLRDLFERSPPRGVLLLMSDFLMDDLEEVFARCGCFGTARGKSSCCTWSIPTRSGCPRARPIASRAWRTTARVNCSPAEIRAAYQERFAAHLAAVRTLALANGCDYGRVSTAVPYLQTVGGFLVERAG